MQDLSGDGKDYLGKGWRFPPRWRREAGEKGPVGVELVRAEEDVRQAILIILRTGVGERVMHPTFGAGIDRYVFAPRTVDTCFRLREEVEKALLLWEPRIVLEEVSCTPSDDDTGRINVFVEYRIDRHRRPESLVVPFYVGEAGGRPVEAGT